MGPSSMVPDNGMLAMGMNRMPAQHQPGMGALAVPCTQAHHVPKLIVYQVDSTEQHCNWRVTTWLASLAC
jgi:hypothetical protein